MQQNQNPAQKAALYGVLLALAIVLSFIETMIPLPVPVPGIKLGLSNLVTIVGLYVLGIPGAVSVTILRVLLVGFTFGNAYSMTYGLSGSIFSLLMMSLGKKSGWFSQTGISILGGVFHNIGQITFAVLVTKTLALYSYLPVLLIAGCLTGAVIGIVGSLVTKRLLMFTGKLW